MDCGQFVHFYCFHTIYTPLKVKIMGWTFKLFLQNKKLKSAQTTTSIHFLMRSCVCKIHNIHKQVQMSINLTLTTGTDTSNGSNS